MAFFRILGLEWEIKWIALGRSPATTSLLLIWVAQFKAKESWASFFFFNSRWKREVVIMILGSSSNKIQGAMRKPTFQASGLFELINLMSSKLAQLISCFLKYNYMIGLHRIILKKLCLFQCHRWTAFLF